MTVGVKVDGKPRKLYGDERVLFRTHSEILTDRRVIARGVTYSFDQIEKVEVVPMPYYVPFQAARALALLAVALLVMSFFGVVGRDALPGDSFVHLILAVPLSAFAIFAPWLIPTHTLRLRTESGKVTIIRGGEPDYLRTVADKVRDAMAQRAD